MAGSLERGFIALGMAVLLAGAVVAQEPGAAQADSAMSRPSENAVTAPVDERAEPSTASVTVAGKRIDYTVTPGTLTVRDDDGEPIASMFYVAYTVDEVQRGMNTRPVTFLFNGGPGSSTMWLHMGSFGPVRVHTPTDQVAGPAPFDIGPNPESIIDFTDLVFIDALGTGLSRPLGNAKGEDFWGVDKDVDIFSSTVQRYITKYDRWNSPKFLLGESYGTLRGAGMADELLTRGVTLNGVVLLSTILNYGIRTPGFDRIHVTYLPSYAATAWYHKTIENRPAELEPFLDEVREYARGPYLAALAKGDDLGAEEMNQVAAQLAAYTGLSEEFLKQNDLRVNLSRFRKELLRAEGRTVGRLDSRFVGIDVDEAGGEPQYDAADAAISGAYISAQNAYLFGTLGYETEMYYRPNFYREIAPAWDRGHTGPDGKMLAANTAVDLAYAMRRNPHMKVLALNGYYDMATPFFGAEYDLKHMQLDPALRDNLTFTYYESGHMIYIHPESMTALRRDLKGFYESAVPTK
ncbi:MAG: carboxypeptidase C (cathepsin A) [Congregibacter sp.]|jgi:carboxypeptidase C (cathepsin A)